MDGEQIGSQETTQGADQAQQGQEQQETQGQQQLQLAGVRNVNAARALLGV